MSGTKLSFSLNNNQKKKLASVRATSSLDGFETQTEPYEAEDINTDLPKDPLVIPVQEDLRKSLQEQARLRREKEEQLNEQEQNVTSQEDQAAIEALTKQAGESSTGDEKTSKLIIEGGEDTFQREKAENTDAQLLQDELNRLAPEVSVESDVYRKVPIADFGAAMLRGMGWTGQVETSDVAMSLPRPSRLGLGATPKLLDAPTHGKMRRQDQVKRDEQRKQQQEEYEKRRLLQIKLDKQQTIQQGSIVWVDSRRAIIRKWQGVPGLNMCLVHFEGDREPVKVKKGDIQLIERKDLQEMPFEEPVYENNEKMKYTGQKQEEKSHDREDDRSRSSKPDSRHRDSRRDDRRSNDEDESRERKRHRDIDSSSRHDSKRRKDDDRGVFASSSSRQSTWLIPHIRVRVISGKLGKQYYKEKGVVVDVTRKGVATLTMGGGQVLQAPERYLETALPKVGGNACILAGKNRWAKGKLLERDSRKNQGSVQVFEDMNIVTTSLDDMAEWCGPLDDDLME